MNHPVGTGPYRLRNGHPAVASFSKPTPVSRRALPACTRECRRVDQGRCRLDEGQAGPQIGRIDIAIIEETNPRLLMFNGGS